MGLQELMLLVIMLLSSLYSPASFAPLTKNLIQENQHENMRDNIYENNTTFGSGGAMASHSKHTTALIQGGGGGGGGGGGRPDGNGGQSNTSPQGGGNGMVPVYAAGASGYARNHKGGAITYAPCLTRGFAVLIVTSTYLLLYIPM